MKQLTLEYFNECVEKNRFEFMRNEINCPLDEFLAKVKTLLINYLRWKKGIKTKPDRKNLKKLGDAINDFLQTADTDTIRGLAIEIGLLDLIDKRQYLPGHRDKNGLRNCFDGKGNVLSGDHPDDAEVLQTMLQGLLKACTLKETNPAKRGQPEKSADNIFAILLANLAEENGYEKFTRNEAPRNSFFRLLQNLFPGETDNVIKGLQRKAILPK
jgi:hypothetical protein